MKETTSKWEVSIIELHNGGERFKVTRRLPGLAVAETRLFQTKEEAKRQIDEWLE